jgi:hypothetical protein
LPLPVLFDSPQSALLSVSHVASCDDPRCVETNYGFLSGNRQGETGSVNNNGVEIVLTESEGWPRNIPTDEPMKKFTPGGRRHNPSDRLLALEFRHPISSG